MRRGAMENHRGLSASISKPRPYFNCDEEDGLRLLGTGCALAYKGCVLVYRGVGVAVVPGGRTALRVGAWLRCKKQKPWVFFLFLTCFGPFGP
ncbi:hypothetical protein ES288_A04G029200v1 [Gossypium darwinii]|uniref:Uncharacterized protein n=1 Tax=Gossypium darwinii TaxID=34276 RepID=A0A5D2GUI4_GOSDA|nr:hypothetical protein ES288_A04G029200v1 [Gossypium darwinii]